MAIDWVLPVRGVQAVFSIIALGISAHIVAVFNDAGFGDTDASSRFDFNVFESVFCLLSLIYLVAVGLVMQDSVLAHPVALVVLDFLNWVFWLAAFATVADLLDGATSTGEPSALLAFGVLNWLLFSATLGWNVFGLMKGRSAGRGAA